MRHRTLIAGQFFPDWFVYSLPNGFWAFSYTLLITAIWRKNKAAMKYLWFATIPVLIFGFEFLQYLGLIKGTFSFPDLIAGFCGILAAITIELLTNKTNNYEKKIT